MNISSKEAAQSLREIDSTRSAMRAVVRSHRGHLHLWLWGCVWMACSLLNWRGGERTWRLSLCLTLAGVAGSFTIGLIQGRQVRSPIDKRFIAVCVAVLAFGYGAWPLVLGAPHTEKTAYGLGMLIWMQLYIVAGIWFDTYWLWVGILVTVLIIAGLVFFPAFFWGCTFLAGAALVATGFYVRYLWR